MSVRALSDAVIKRARANARPGEIVEISVDGVTIRYVPAPAAPAPAVESALDVLELIRRHRQED